MTLDENDISVLLTELIMETQQTNETSVHVLQALEAIEMLLKR
jgi:hypothetical protein